jgi:hypothetical protein
MTERPRRPTVGPDSAGCPPATAETGNLRGLHANHEGVILSRQGAKRRSRVEGSPGSSGPQGRDDRSVAWSRERAREAVPTDDVKDRLPWRFAPGNPGDPSTPRLRRSAQDDTHFDGTNKSTWNPAATARPRRGGPTGMAFGAGSRRLMPRRIAALRAGGRISQGNPPLRRLPRPGHGHNGSGVAR